MKPRSPIALKIVLFIIFLISTIAVFADGFDFISTPVFWGILLIVVLLFLIYDYLSSLVESEQYGMLTPEQQEKFLADRKVPYLERMYKSAFGTQEGIGEEVEILDHGFDGIVELDNKLPTWWLSLFYFGVAFCVVYLVRYSFTEFAHPEVELATFNAKHDADIIEYEKQVPQKQSPDEMVFATENIEKGKQLFQDKCAVCHNPDGGAKGNAGANLTDDYWRNISDADLYKNIVNVIWNGSAYDKTMVNFGSSGEIKGNDIEKIGAYIVSLNQDGNSPDGKEPLGKVVKEWAKDPMPSDASLIVSANEMAGAAVDSTAAVAQ